jgi:hypothetical protein
MITAHHHRLDRRADKRRRPEEHGIWRVRVRPGQEVTLIDMSSGGVLVETSQRLLPGAKIEVHLRRHANDAAEIVRGRVTRCAVVRLSSTAITYRGAIAFDRPLPGVPNAASHGYSVPTANVSQLPANPGSQFP